MISAQQPNILIITTDEMRKDSLSCYGNKVIHTPNLDRLAAESILFDCAYTPSPACLPARCSILTGMYPLNNKAHSNLLRNKPIKGKPNLFGILKENGYRTALVGKCHFDGVPYGDVRPDLTLPYDGFKEHYMELGIDHLDLQDDKQVSAWFYDDYSKELDQAGYLKAYRDAVWNKDYAKVFSFPGPEEWHPDSWVGRKAKEFIDHYDAARPLCAWISFSGPHYPFDAPEAYYSHVNKEELARERIHILEGELDDPKRIHHDSYHGPGGGVDGSGVAPGKACKNYTKEYWLNLRRNNYANIAQIDAYIGGILEAAEKKFGDNLMVIFTSDHGEMLGHHGLWGKGNCGYEDVINVALTVKYPGESKAVRTKARVMTNDIMVSCLNAAGIACLETDGRDFRESMADGGRKYIVSVHDGLIAMSDGRFKYIHLKRGKRAFYELFDLEKDPHEFHNVADDPSYLEKLNELRKVMLDLLVETALP